MVNASRSESIKKAVHIDGFFYTHLMISIYAITLFTFKSKLKK